MTRATFVCVALASFVLSTCAFYLPGIAPKDYANGNKLDVMANSLTSKKNKLPFDYYWLPYCGHENPELHHSKPVNLGQILVGERSKPTDFNILMGESKTCTVLCRKTLTAKHVKRFKRRIDQKYNVRLNLDNMPLVTKQIQKDIEIYNFGYHVGDVKDGKWYINNHLSFTVLFHKTSTSSNFNPTNRNAGLRIVGFEVEASSVDHGNFEGNTAPPSSCPPKSSSKNMELAENAVVTFTYDVKFFPSSNPWATRWDPLLKADSNLREIQWFSIVNSLMISLFLTALVGTVMMRTVLRDFVRYNQLEEEDEADDVTGWKLVHGDVFRTPRYPVFLSVCYGSGAQTLKMSSITLIFALLGFLSPANRGGLVTAMLSLWVLSSAVCGYTSARLYSAFEGASSRKLVTLGSAFLFPGLSFSVFFVLNLFVWMSGSSSAVPFFTLILLLFMWFGVSVPLVFCGAYIAYRRKPIEFPVRTNQIPRQIPTSPLNIPQYVYIVLAGILPFGTIFMELVIILNSILQNQILYLFGMLTIVFLILIATCAEMSIVFTYLTLAAEQWTWWWQAFAGSASSGLYMFMYCLSYLYTQQKTGGVPFVSMIMFISYSLVFSTAFALLTGTVGFFSSFWFVRKIYSNIRVD